MIITQLISDEDHMHSPQREMWKMPKWMIFTSYSRTKKIFTPNKQPKRVCIDLPTDGQVMLSECDLF